MTLQTRVIGIGNPLMGDDGLGISAIEELQKQPLPASVELIDGGCGGLSLLPLFANCRQVLIIDAADFTAAPGDLRILHNADLALLPKPTKLANGHLFSLPEILQIAAKLQPLPPLTLYLVQVATCHSGIGLSLAVKAAIPSLVKQILKTLRNS